MERTPLRECVEQTERDSPPVHSVRGRWAAHGAFYGGRSCTAVWRLHSKTKAVPIMLQLPSQMLQLGGTWPPPTWSNPVSRPHCPLPRTHYPTRAHCEAVCWNPHLFCGTVSVSERRWMAENFAATQASHVAVPCAVCSFLRLADTHACRGSAI